MKKFKMNSKYLAFAAVLALALALLVGCSQSPIMGNDINDAVDPNTPAQSDSLFNPGQPSYPGEGSVVEETNSSQSDDLDQPESSDIQPELSVSAPIRVLQRKSNIFSPLFNLLDSVLKTVSRLLGGVVSLLDVSLQIPPLALDSNTRISIEIPDLDYYVYDFGPDGLQFNKPATMTISYKNANMNGVNESNIRLAWWDKDAGNWVDMPCVVDQTNNIVTGPVYHFSAYGLVSD